MVVDPLSLSVLGGVALTEGIKFLYGQATELLQRRRELGDGADSPGTSPTELVEQPARVLDAPLTSGSVDLAVVASREPELRELRRALADYAEGLADVDPADDRLLQQADALRTLLEVAYGQHLTFRGENRPATGTPLSVEVAPQDNRGQVQINADKIQGQQVGHHNTQTNTFGS